MASIDLLLALLEGVRQTGLNSWVAKCPAHADRSPSLSVGVLADGRILLHDFAGCDPHEVVSAIGLTLADLFPAPLAHHFEPVKPRVPAIDVLRCLAREVNVVAIAVSDVVDGRPLSAADADRVAHAAGLITEALELAQ